MHKTRYKIIAMGVLALFGLSNAALAYHTVNGRIVDENDKPVHIDGVNWSGFQDTNFIDQLGSDNGYVNDVPFYPFADHYIPALKGIGIINMLKNPEDFSELTTVTKENGVSFKTIRLPINPTNLDNPNPFPDWKLNKRLTNGQAPTSGNGVFCNWDGAVCKTMGVTEALYKFIGELKKNQIRVLIDFHQMTPGNRTGKIDDIKLYKNGVSQLVKAIQDNKFDHVIGIDVFNEPYNMVWFPKDDNKSAEITWVEVIAEAAKIVYANEYTRNLLLFVEGAKASEQDPQICITGNIPANPPDYGSAYTTSDGCANNGKSIHFASNYGENFQALLDPEDAKKGSPKMGKKLRDELAKLLEPDVLTWLLGDPAKNNDGAHLVFSPHVYGKHVAGWQSSQAVSMHRFEWNFGFLQNANYPVVIGESGYLLSEPIDVVFFNDSVKYYLKQKEQGAKKGINHNLFFWTFNTNSGDTGGIAKCPATSKETYTCIRDSIDGAKLVPEKEAALHDLFNDETK